MDTKKTIEWLSKNKLKIEAVLIALVAVSLLLMYLGQNAAVTLMMLTMTTLAGFYFLSDYIPSGVPGRVTEILNKMAAIGSSVCVIGILFSVMKLSGSREMLMIGSITMVACGLGLGFISFSNSEKRLIPLIARIVVLGTVCGMILVLTGSSVGAH